jgi:hypothetical protein
MTGANLAGPLGDVEVQRAATLLKKRQRNSYYRTGLAPFAPSEVPRRLQPQPDAAFRLRSGLAESATYVPKAASSKQLEYMLKFDETAKSPIPPRSRE